MKPKAKKLVLQTVQPTSTSPSAGTSTPTTPAAGTPSGTTSSGVPSAAPSVGQTNLPPDLTLPPVPAAFLPVNLKDYRGTFPRAGQITAAPGALVELDTQTSYASTFGPAVPTANTIASLLTVAAAWSAQRTAVESYLVYVKSFEAITWKACFSDLKQLSAMFKLVDAQNPQLTAAFPELRKLLDVPKVIAKRGAATRVRKAKEEATANAKVAAAVKTANAAAAAAPATGGLVLPVVTASNGNGATGGGTTK